MTRVLAVIALFAVASAVQAQDACAEGRVRTQGLCCWPGQTFSTVSRRCEGTPECPGGLAAHGAACVAVGEASVELATGVAIPSGYAPRPRPEAPRDEEPVAPRARSIVAWPATHESASTGRAAIGQGRDEPLIVMALAIYDIGFVFGWLGVMVDELARACGGGSCNTWQYAFVPLAGGVAAVTSHTSPLSRNDWVAFPFGALSVCLQGIGLVAAAIAVENRTTELTYHRRGADFTLALVPAAPGAVAGLSLQGTY